MSKSGFHMAHGMSLVGTKVVYLKDKFADSNTELLILDYCPVQCANLVKKKGTCEISYCDIKDLMDTHPSCFVERVSDDDEILTPDVFEALEVGSNSAASAHTQAN